VDHDPLTDFMTLMAQVGTTTFALMFAAVQFRWSALASTRLGKLGVATALLELLTITLVPVAYAAQVPYLWQVVGLLCGIAGWVSTQSYSRAVSHRTSSNALETPGMKMQRRVLSIPYVSYGLLMVSATASMLPAEWWPTSPLDEKAWWQHGLAVVMVWFLFSGLSEVFVSLSPNMFEAEPMVHPLPVRVGERLLACYPPPFGVNRPVVVLLPDVWGLQPDVSQLGERLAARGHGVVIVDPYDGKSPQFPVLHLWRRRRTQTDRLADLAEQARDWAAAQRWSGAFAVVGLSIGGNAALKRPGAWDAVVAFYPDRPDTEHTVETHARSITVVLAGRDRQAKARGDVFKALLAKGGTTVEIREARHGFMGSGRSIPRWLRLIGWRFVGPSQAAAEEGWDILCMSLDSIPLLKLETILEEAKPTATTWRARWRRLK